MKRAVTEAGPRVKQFEASCFDGYYVTGDITPEYLDRVENARLTPMARVDDADRNQMNLKFSTVQE